MAVHCIVLGGGVSGLAAAWRLAERGVEVDVLEADAALGGLAGTSADGDCCMDIGPHSFFSDDAEVERAVLALFAQPPPARPRTVKLFYEGRYLDYPLTVKSAFLQLGLGSGVRAAASFAAQRVRPRRTADAGEQTVEDWAIGNFGEHLYRTFFRPYTEQFWRIPCDELSARTIPAHTRTGFVDTLRRVLRRTTGRGTGSLIDRELLPTYSPERGFFEIPSRMAAKVAQAGGRIHRGCRATGVEVLRAGGVRVRYTGGDGERALEGDRVISTVPLPLLIGMLRPAAPAAVRESADRLEYRSLVVLGMRTRKQRVLGCGYLYQLNRPYNRLFEMNEFSPRSSPPGSNVVGAEIPCRQGDAVWSATKEQLYERCGPALAADGFLATGDVEHLLVARAPHAYPVYRTGYAAHLGRVLGHLRTLDCLRTLGRCGEFRYMDIDHCLRRAFDLIDAPGAIRAA